MKRLQGFLCLVSAVLFLAGCTLTAPLKVAEKEREVTAIPLEKPPEERAIVPQFFRDRDLFLEGVAQLNKVGQTGQAAARRIFSDLIQNHPESRWRQAAETFVRVIEEREASREMARREKLQVEKASLDRSRALQEIELLKKALRDLAEKLQVEITALSRENERLKNDLQRLKSLEMELQKREKMLR